MIGLQLSTIFTQQFGKGLLLISYLLSGNISSIQFNFLYDYYRDNDHKLFQNF